MNLGNIHFLMEQSALALENAGRYSVAKELLNIDELTGLYNYRYLEIALEREIRRAERYGLSMAIIFLDVDMLKVVNDTLRASDRQSGSQRSCGRHQESLSVKSTLSSDTAATNTP